MIRENKTPGYITVYLSLSLLIMLSFIFTLIEGIRLQTIRFQTECVMDMGLNSIFAEYNRELYKQYGLFGIDTSYGSEDVDKNRTGMHLLQYMNMNFTAPGSGRIPGYKDLTAVHADNVSLSDVSYLSDGGGTVLKYQIIQYMKEKSGLSLLDPYLPDDPGDFEGIFDGLEGERNDNHGIIDEILKMLNEARAEDEDEISISNPADHIDGMRASPLLAMAVKNSSDISGDYVDPASYISHRGYEEGAGLREDQSAPDGVTDKILFQMYLQDMCGDFMEKKEGSALSYQLEYLLYGKGSDLENLEEFAKQLFMIRYVVNTAYLFSSGIRQAEAAELAAAVTAGIAQPQLFEAVKITILFAWCYAESVQDLRILFDGNKAATVKSDPTWNIELSELLMFTSCLDSYSEAPDGKTYEDYLKALLFIKNEDTLRMRLMDLMEMDIRMTPGNRHFKIDSCIYQLQAEVNVSSKYGSGYTIKRRYSYE